MLAAAVIVGAPAVPHFTPVNVAVKLPAPVFKRRVNDLPVVAVGMVNVQLPVRVAVWIVPLVRSMVLDVPVLPIATTPSVKLLTVGLVNVLAVSVWVSVVPTTAPEGAVLAANAVRSESYACTVDPIAAVIRASAAVLKSVTWLAVWVCEVGVRASDSLESFPWHAVPADVP
ncbi:hypothetical protein [Mycobacteroides chelonae]|uniref:hypothetical protein n=1 Tax=Mycobacteroides chelonae TaxID=1774 RepID=UPI0012FF9C4E|nr:hypothetical protein [Mycobacteroides chelonae]